MNRRTILAGAAVLPATAVPAIATDDPIYKAIDAHRRALEIWKATGAWEDLNVADDHLESLLAVVPSTVMGACDLIEHWLAVSGDEAAGRVGISSSLRRKLSRAEYRSPRSRS
jgi:hypothetical protein